jgi:Methyltransferase domain
MHRIIRDSLSNRRNAGRPSRLKYAIAAVIGTAVVIYIVRMTRWLTGCRDEKYLALSKQLRALTKTYQALLKTKLSAALPAALEDKALLDLLVASESDKYFRHHYENYYIPWLAPFQTIPKLKLLEIGADKGKSLLLWSQYFSDPALILGLAYGEAAKDIDETVQANKKGGKLREIVQVLKGDQSKKETMETLRTMGPYHIIIDDGSHVPEHMAFSLFSLWNSVAPGGLYIIEDLECNYWPSGSYIYGYPLLGTGVGTSPKDNFVEKTKQLIDTLVRHQIGATKETMSIMPGDETICSIEFGKNIVVLKKCTEAQLINAPPYQGVSYDADHMAEWVRNAKSTNPRGFQ